jgi:chitinase
MNKYPSQGNGYPGTNFGGSCWGGSYVYSGPGSDPSLNDLQAKCPSLVSAIPDCQTMYGKKILLSLGGFVASGQTAYQLMSAQDGEDLADFLWGAFGPLTANWTAANLPRPFDTEGTVNEVDGFDFDIEVTTSGMPLKD